MQPLTPDTIDARLAALATGWHRAGDAIVGERECADFAAAVALVNAIAEQAERSDHHPDILLHGYRRVRITLTTHSAGGVTERDFALAAAIDAL
jgi:4a-hydroxytetrahydrobiopterin dehydratase